VNHFIFAYFLHLHFAVDYVVFIVSYVDVPGGTDANENFLYCFKDLPLELGILVIANSEIMQSLMPN